MNLPAGGKMSCSDCASVPSLRCAACGEGPLIDVLCLGELPLANALLNAPDEHCERYPLHLVVCTSCAAVQLTRQVDPAVMFGDYPYFSSQADTMVASARALVGQLITQRGLGSDDLVLEIGSNDGYLLRWYVEAGVPVVGVDPAQTVAEHAESVGVPTEVAWFGDEVADRYEGRCSVVHANNVLAHVPDPTAILRSARRVLRRDGLLVAESPWLARMVAECQFDQTYHEHRLYWSLSAFSACLERAGLHVVDVERLAIHGGSLRVFASPDRNARPSASVAAVLAEEHERRIDRPEGLADFGERVQARIGRLRAWRESLPGPVACYGAAAKATMMLNAIGPVDFCVDSTPAKQGRYMPGVGVLIVSPEFLTPSAAPDCLLGAWNYAEEVARKASAYTAAGGRLWTTTPAPIRLASPQPVPESRRTRREIVDDYARCFYNHRGYSRTTWRGVEIVQYAEDLLVLGELLYRVRPAVFVDCGSYVGGLALFVADHFEAMGHGEVVSVDVTDWAGPEGLPDHPRITWLRGSDTDPAMVAEIAGEVAGRPCMVHLDSDHSEAHVLAQLDAYAPLVSLGSYLIVGDTNVRQVRDDYGPGPDTALAKWLPDHPELVIDRQCERLLLSAQPGGWLRRVR